MDELAQYRPLSQLIQLFGISKANTRDRSYQRARKFKYPYAALYLRGNKTAIFNRYTKGYVQSNTRMGPDERIMDIYVTSRDAARKIINYLKQNFVRPPQQFAEVDKVEKNFSSQRANAWSRISLGSILKKSFASKDVQ
ncbi:hypothetical protein M5K25_000166 [Dendrobium thyrsiflorum]|uniref:Uncharacterized protein n=1 Tax=Dendrobium thyrsiflorum TaxID=117978 RepID=A0ABD0VT87_DENTH